MLSCGFRNPSRDEKILSGTRAVKGQSMADKKYRASSKDELNNPDYSFIKRDLRRIFLIAVSFVVIMIILAFILR